MPLHFASFYGNLPLIKLLIKHGGDIYACNSQRVNMLHVSAQGDSVAAAMYYLEKGFDVDMQD